MSVNINLSAPSRAHQEVGSNFVCHRMPCKIDYRGLSNISKYFTPNIRTKGDDSSILSCSFRGRPLLGKEMSVPEGYVGVVLEEKPGLSKSADIRDLNIIGSFDSFTAWNWDHEPTNEDKLSKAFDWIDLAAAVHQHVDASSSDTEDKAKDLDQHQKRKRNVSYD